MIENFKTYINTLLCLGIFITILQLIIPKNKSRKYIYSLIGIIMIITVISPVANLLENKDMEGSINEVMANIDKYSISDEGSYNEYKEANEDIIKKQVKFSIESEIKNKLSENNIVVSDIKVYLEENYDIKKITVKINNLNGNNTTFSNLNSVIKYINKEYQIDYSKIEVIEEGK